jgi:hypothetical protein
MAKDLRPRELLTSLGSVVFKSGDLFIQWNEPNFTGLIFGIRIFRFTYMILLSYQEGPVNQEPV